MPRCAASGGRGFLHVCPPPAIGAGACSGLPTRAEFKPRSSNRRGVMSARVLIGMRSNGGGAATVAVAVPATNDLRCVSGDSLWIVAEFCLGVNCLVEGVIQKQALSSVDWPSCLMAVFGGECAMPMLRSHELGPLTQAMALKHTQDKPVEKATRRAGVVPPMPAPALLTSVLHGRRSTRCCLMTHTAQSVCCCLMTAAAAPCARPRHCRLRPRRQGAAPPAAPPKRPPPNPGSLACVSRTHPSPPALCHLPHMRCMILWCVVGGVAERGGGVYVSCLVS